jgi:hypothetical protein
MCSLWRSIDYKLAEDYMLECKFPRYFLHRYTKCKSGCILRDRAPRRTYISSLSSPPQRGRTGRDLRSKLKAWKWVHRSKLNKSDDRYLLCPHRWLPNNIGIWWYRLLDFFGIMLLEILVWCVLPLFYLTRLLEFRPFRLRKNNISPFRIKFALFCFYQE